MAACHLGHQVGGRGRHHDRVGVAREPDMPDIKLARGVEQVGEDVRSPASALAESGVMNSCAAAVRMQRTAMCRSRSRRMRSSDL